MKVLTKPTVLLAVCIILSALAVSSLIAYAAMTLTSNTVTIIPTASPTLTLVANSTAPYIGDTVKLTATISGSAQNGVSVTYFSNGTALGTASTTNGIAVYNLLIANTVAQAIQAQTTYSPP